jgi:Glycosyl transferase family 2
VRANSATGPQSTVLCQARPTAAGARKTVRLSRLGGAPGPSVTDVSGRDQAWTAGGVARDGRCYRAGMADSVAATKPVRKVALAPDEGVDALRARTAIVVVHYANLDDTRGCLRSLRTLSEPPSEVIVVDNASPERDDIVLQDEFGPWATIIRSGLNGGYGFGANVGIRLALERGVDYVWILNNDTVVDALSLSHLRAAMEADASVGIASPLILGSEIEDWSGEVWFAGGGGGSRPGYRCARRRSRSAKQGALFGRLHIRVRDARPPIRIRSRRPVRGVVLPVLGRCRAQLQGSARRMGAPGRSSGARPSPRAWEHRKAGQCLSFDQERARRGWCYGTPVQLSLLTLRTCYRGLLAIPLAIVNRSDAREELRGYVAGLVRLAVQVRRRAWRP